MARRGTSANRRGNTAAQHDFARIPNNRMQRSVFNRSFGLKTSFNSGYLVPVFVDEALPGDSFRVRTRSLVRMSTPLLPMMDNIFLDIFYFAVPIRLVWDNFAKFMGEQRNPGDSIDFVVPIFDEVTVATNSLSDYLGLPLGSGLDFASLWHRAYNLIWNEWFRDQNLQNSVVVDLDDGPDTLSDYVLLRRGKRHDYFTSALPFTQKGLSTVALGTVVPSGDGQPVFLAAGGTTPRKMDVSNLSTSNSWRIEGGNVYGGASVPGLIAWSDPKLTATLTSINVIRQAFQIQKLLERDARGGTRYTEIVRAHFNVISPDARLQRPEYLGGGSTRVNVVPVPNTNISGGSTGPVPTASGKLSAFAVANIDGIGFSKSFTEHTLLLGLVNVRADLTYQQGIPRMFSRSTRYDFYWPEFSHLGEQAILNKEIFADGSATDELTFGYQERYAEYRYKPSMTSGYMRSTAAASLDYWHLGLEFASAPLLNATFIQDEMPFSRVLAIADPEFFGDFFFDMRCARPMPTYSVPGLVDHF